MSFRKNWSFNFSLRIVKYWILFIECCSFTSSHYHIGMQHSLYFVGCCLFHRLSVFRLFVRDNWYFRSSFFNKGKAPPSKRAAAFFSVALLMPTWLFVFFLFTRPTMQVPINQSTYTAIRQLLLKVHFLLGVQFCTPYVQKKGFMVIWCKKRKKRRITGRVRK